MRIGVIGVGNIAEKAYLPTYAKNQGKIDFYFATRNKETKKRIHEMYGFDHLYESIDFIKVNTEWFIDIHMHLIFKTFFG